MNKAKILKMECEWLGFANLQWLREHKNLSPHALATDPQGLAIRHRGNQKGKCLGWPWCPVSLRYQMQRFLPITENHWETELDSRIFHPHNCELAVIHPFFCNLLSLFFLMPTFARVGFMKEEGGPDQVSPQQLRNMLGASPHLKKALERSKSSPWQKSGTVPCREGDVLVQDNSPKAPQLTSTHRQGKVPSCLCL